MSLRRNIGLPIPSAYMQKDYYKHLDFSEDIEWLKSNIPELIKPKKWKDFQILNVGMDYSTQIKRLSSLQTPLDIELFKDFAITLWLFEIDGEYFRQEMGFHEEDIKGVYKVFLSHNQEALNKYKNEIKHTLDEYFELSYKSRCDTHTR